MPHSNNLCYEFGPFRLNVGQRILSRDGEVISLTPKATDLLLVLLRNAGELVLKDEVMREVWPDSFVEEANVSQNIFTLRRAFGDDRTAARYIETVTGRGYRFVAPVKTVDSGAPTDPAQNARERSEPPPILAVLPFVNATGDRELEYLADGVSENVINSLSQTEKLRVMSRTTVFRYKGREIDPKQIAKELAVDVMLLGKIISRPSGLIINVELLKVSSGWQLWGESFDFELNDILEIQDEIARRISTTLRLKLTGDEEKRITARYTKSSLAYQSYIEGRFHWSRYTREAVERAIRHFREAIEIDPNYALAYAGIVDCYLRLATNYLPPDKDTAPTFERERESSDPNEEEIKSFEATEYRDPKVKLRHEWDWKGAQRELRRANELKADYPAAHQWHAAYLYVRQLYQQSYFGRQSEKSISDLLNQELSARIPSAKLTTAEEVQVLCAIAREQIDVGNYSAASLVLQRWWQLGIWPKVDTLVPQFCADLLFTAGELSGFVASAGQQPIGQKNAENLLSGSIALFEQIGSSVRAAECRIELALCYYRQGNFDLGRQTLLSVLNNLSEEEMELRCLALIRLASLERHAGRLQDALSRLTEAKSIAQISGPWVTGRHHLELASTYKDLAVSEGQESLFELALDHHRKSLYEFEAIGNFRLLAIAENNLGFLFLTLGRFQSAQHHLMRAQRIFESLEDEVRCAQVNDTLARLYLGQDKFDLAAEAINRAVTTLLAGDEDVLLAEVLTTKGVVLAKLHKYHDAEKTLEWGYSVALRCGDHEGAGRALLVMIEEIGNSLSTDARKEIGLRILDLLADSQQSSIRARVEACQRLIRRLDQEL